MTDALTGLTPMMRQYRELKQRYPRIGLALQSALRRTKNDVFELPDASTVRLVKGSYLEPPDVAFQERAEVDRCFARLFSTLVARVGTYPKVAAG